MQVKLIIPSLLMMLWVAGCGTTPEDQAQPRLIVQNKSAVPEGAQISQGQAIDIALEVARKRNLGTAPSSEVQGHATFLKDARQRPQWQVSYTSPPDVDWIITINAVTGAVERVFDLRKSRN